MADIKRKPRKKKSHIVIQSVEMNRQDKELTEEQEDAAITLLNYCNEHGYRVTGLYFS